MGSVPIKAVVCRLVCSVYSLSYIILYSDKYILYCNIFLCGFFLGGMNRFITPDLNHARFISVN